MMTYSIRFSPSFVTTIDPKKGHLTPVTTFTVEVHLQSRAPAVEATVLVTEDARGEIPLTHARTVAKAVTIGIAQELNNGTALISNEAQLSPHQDGPYFLYCEWIWRRGVGTQANHLKLKHYTDEASITPAITSARKQIAAATRQKAEEQFDNDEIQALTELADLLPPSAKRALANAQQAG